MNESRGNERGRKSNNGRPKKTGGAMRLALAPRTGIESRIPLVELASEIFIQRLCPCLQEQMGTPATPYHLLFFDEPFA
jgi:hypothetical protein